ncbi:MULTISPECIES: TRAP transporter substrate-binding protein [Brevibacillus]|jgi:tripartite ATP-independent transporter DctP family solute receptor|uniref:TRAP transporter substrate-binding protein n=1 Tax=Brevibacillus TaxID=55080 RepID=UPI0004F2AE52|nr:TRAP transporter substrate-binding protein [Brevibacillus borstelensis]KKX54263.1 C4-dicarboxylate ABC transporter substrate-binding protein [Brevibacillus borstelensis cifa_chp40]MBE5396523.1 TRAP transporter substrate-binding protein [Brevibacillus borstelensis]MED2008308.1 TRAP transporter substrate-binding protein [Brevibacillus borstelensis]
MKKMFSTLVVSTMVLLTACGGGGSEAKPADSGNAGGQQAAASGEAVTLKVGHTLADTSHYQVGLEKFKELVESKTNGSVKIETFPNGALGGERDMIEGLNVGSIDMVLSSTGPMSGFVQEVTVVDLPFLFRDADHAHKVLDGEVGTDLLAKVESSMGVKALAWWENGFRHVTNNAHPVTKPEDLKGFKIRTMENDIHMDSFKAMGAQPTPMAFTELFTALQQGTIDAEENPIPVIMTSRFYEVQKHLSLTRHFYSPSILMMSQAKFDALSPEQQKAIEEAALEAGKFERETVAEMEKQYLSELKSKGMEIVENPDLQPFVDTVKPVYEKYEPQFGKELIEKIRNTQ